jgi:hypothetical protein
MRIVFYTACPGCRTRVRAWTRLIGRYCYCPLCSHRMMVRAPEVASLVATEEASETPPSTHPRGSLRAPRGFVRSTLLAV